MEHPQHTRPAPRHSQPALRLVARIIACALLALITLPLVAFAAHAQPVALSTSPDLVAQLAALELKLSNPAVEAKSRADFAKQADDLRARLIALQPTDYRAATWLADRAAYQLDLAAATGLDLVCIFGLPTPAQAAQVRPFAQSALDLSQQADAAASSAVSALESRLLDRANPPTPGALAEIESRLAKLVETEQARRIPILQAMARTLIAAADPDPAAAAALATAAADELHAVPTLTPALTTARNFALGEALIQSSRGGHAQELLALARAQFTPEPDTRADLRDRLRARVGLLRAGATVMRDPAPTPTVRQLDAEAGAAYLVAEASRDLARRPQLISEAVRALFASAPTEQELAAGSFDTRALICEKIASILPKTIPIAALPPEAAFCAAVTLARTLKPEDAQERASIVALLTLAADDTEASGSLCCSARWERAVVLARSLDQLAAFDALARVFTEDPACIQSPDAARRTAESFIAANPPGRPQSPGWSLRRGVFRAALLFLLQREPNDRWRTEFIRFVADDLPASAPGSTGLPDDFTRAAKCLDEITSDAVRPGAQAALADALALHLDHRRTQAASARPRGPAWTALTPAARAALDWSRTHDAPRTPLYTLLVGETLAYADDRAALAILAPLAGTPIDQPGALLFIRSRFALARAQRLNNEQARAFTTLREAADQLEGAPGTKTRDPAFWAAWTEMLAILQSLNTDGSRTEDLRVQIKRLELLDPSLGGPPHAETIRKIRDAVKP